MRCVLGVGIIARVTRLLMLFSADGVLTGLFVLPQVENSDSDDYRDDEDDYYDRTGNS